MTLALPAFTPPQRDAVHRLLALKVAGMMGRKFEEADWNDAYCHAKDIPCAKWSNLGIDVTHVGLGIQHKMLCVPSKVTIREFCGTQRMHPSATRSIRVPSTDGDATATARDVLGQYALLIEGWKAKVLDSAPQMVPDLRTGWLLWQDNLREFLYFEERLDAPDGELYTAEWKDSGGGTRKASRNLWVYETATGRKRFSITTSAGAKIQPYFDVPPPTDPNLYHFTVQGEAREGGLIRVWVTQSTAAALRHVAGDSTRSG